MTLRNLEIFVKVCEKMSMSRASEELFVSQSSVSHTVAALERSYGVRLFQRRAGRLYLTGAGEKLYERARKILGEVYSLDDDLGDAGEKPTIRLGCSPTLGEFYVQQLVTSYYEHSGMNNVFIGSYRLDELEHMLLSHELDLALAEGRMHSEFLDELPLFQDRIYYLCRKGSRHITLPESENGECPMVDKQELKGLPLYMQMWDTTAPRFPEKLLTSVGINAHVAGSFNSFSEVISAVKLDLGIGAASGLSFIGQSDIQPFLIKGIDTTRDVSLIMLGKDHVPPQLLELIEFIFTYVKTHRSTL